MKIGFLFAGQGSQYVGMGKDLYETYEEAHQLIDHIQLDIDLKKVMFEGPLEKLTLNHYNQPAIIAVEMMILQQLNKAHIHALYCAGLSLGEYGALASAGVFDPDTAIQIVYQRALAMEKASKKVDSAMAAVLNLPEDQLQKAVEEARSEGYVAICNYNCPGQLVISGERKAVEKASAYARTLGARRVIALNTAGPFHTALLKEAGEELHDYFQQITFHEMKTPVIFNTTAKERDKDETIASLLERQVSHPVYFEKSIRYMIDHGVDTFIEIGPGKVLSGFVAKIDRKVKRYHIEDRKTLENTIKELELLCVKEKLF
ncbi:ACP S-malonyltransferase [Sharpea azabuensis]|uniref:ACP S-malonyltransferase n=1 Tax=Sharpea azabuensis TaxID=322505 RepID=UPI0013D915F9|nr:ACP S-malonyltransferase [Sharpea azabuensis]